MPVQTAAAPEIIEVPEPVARQMPAYQRAHFPLNSAQEPHEVAVSVLAKLLERVVAMEGPIHVEEASRRVAPCFGKEKAGSRIISATQSALAYARRGGANLLTDGSFWFTREQVENPPVRDRSAESGATLKAACISDLEIEAALKIARGDNAGGIDADLVRTAARLMGFKRVRSDLQARISGRLEGA